MKLSARTVSNPAHSFALPEEVTQLFLSPSMHKAHQHLVYYVKIKASESKAMKEQIGN